MHKVLAASFAAAFGAWACATAPADRPTAIRDVITADEIAAVPVTNAYDAIVRLRPHFLQQRRSGVSLTPRAEGPSTIVVYLDGIRIGGPRALQQISSMTVGEIRYLNATDATHLYGTGHNLGAIIVTSRH